MALGTRPIIHAERSYGFVWSVNTLSWVAYDTTMVGGAGGGGGAATIANGADVAEGSTSDIAVTTDDAGTLSGKLRGLVKIFGSVWDSANTNLRVSVPFGTYLTDPSGNNGAFVLNTAPTGEYGLVTRNIPSGVQDVIVNGITTVLVNNATLTVVGAGALTARSGSVSSSGNNTLVTPTAGKKLRVYYLSYNPASPTTLAFRFGAAGNLFLQNNIVQGGSIIAKDYGDLRYVEGAINEELILNLSSAVTAIWNVNYIEV